MTASFQNYNLDSRLLNVLSSRGFTEPTPVQDRILSLEDRSRDIVCQARTGSGKTLAFMLPLLNDIKRGTGTPRLLILSPTRELSLQSASEAEAFGKTLGLEAVELVGGMPMEPQISQLRRGVSIVVGTPGRVLDHINRGTLDLSSVDTVVLDEGDDMLDMGFREELEGILSAAVARNRTWIFSATMPDEMYALAKHYLKDPLHLTLDQEDEQHEDIIHRAYLVPSHSRMEALVNILLWEHPELCLIFCHTRSDTTEVAERLQNEGFLALALHGDMSQRERNSTLTSFRTGRIPILVATNVAARGLDIQGVTHVIQLGLPESLETFVHRSGRTGRAGHEGSNLLVLTPSESGRFKLMLSSSHMRVQWLKVPDATEVGQVQRELKEQSLLACEPTVEQRGWAENLLKNTEAPEDLVAKLLGSLVKDLPSGYALREQLQSELDRRREHGSVHSPAGRRGLGLHRYVSNGGEERGHYSEDGQAIRLNKGRRDEQWSVGRILGVVCDSLGVSRTEIGNIRMRDNYTEVMLSPAAQERFADGGRDSLINHGLMLGEHGETSAFQPHLGGPRERRFDGPREYERPLYGRERAGYSRERTDSRRHSFH